jgi:hypothetical protein
MVLDDQIDYKENPKFPIIYHGTFYKGFPIIHIVV